MNNQDCPIHPDDLPRISQMHADYLADEDGTLTSAAKLQDDAYRLGYQRACQHVESARNLLQLIRQRHASGISLAACKEIDALLLAE